ncbi:MAG: Tfp pilus assembly protein PilF [Shewanella sp.]|jgi:Tfp pilus assembly protein PilF
MKFIPLALVFYLLFLLQGCSSSNEASHQYALENYYHDEHFTLANDLPSADSLFSLSENDIISVRNDLNRARLSKSSSVMRHQWLANYINAQEGGFRYADNLTRSASETFDDREGNCLSLVLLTAAIAQKLDVQVEYQEIDIPPVWDKQGGFYLVNGHINLKLLPQESGHILNVSAGPIQIDFLPGRAMQGYDKRRVSQSMVASMFYNNVAAEALVKKEYDKAYGLLKLSLQQDDQFLPAINTLAVLYRYKGLNDEAEAVYKLALKINPEDMNALYNYAIILAEQDRLDEWAGVHRVMELARIRNPYYYYGMAQQAYFDKEYQVALNWYRRAIEKADYRHEFYFGLSRTYWATGDEHRAEVNMKKALSLTNDTHNKHRYQSKLQAMKSH